MTGTKPLPPRPASAAFPGAPGGTRDGVSPPAGAERLAALLSEASSQEAAVPGRRTTSSGALGRTDVGPAHRWEVAARTRVPSSLLLLAAAGLAVLVWVLLGPGAAPAPEDAGGAVLAEVETTDRAEGPGHAPVATAASPAPAERPVGVPPPAGSPPAASPSAGQRLAVHVTGEVARPGVVHVDPGDRVVDAVEAAGGLTEHAATAAVNLAAPVADGQQVIVPDARKAPAAAADAPAVAGTSAPPGAVPAPGAPGGPVHLNTASAADLEALPRVGPVLAGRIIAFRDQHGGFASVADLDAVPGIGPALMEALAPLVTV